MIGIDPIASTTKFVAFEELFREHRSAIKRAAALRGPGPSTRGGSPIGQIQAGLRLSFFGRDRSQAISVAET